MCFFSLSLSLSLSLCMHTLIHRYRDTYIERESQRMRERERETVVTDMFSFASVCKLQSLNGRRWPRNSSECATSEFTFQASAWSTIFGRTQYAYRLRVYRIQIMGREISWVYQKYWSSGSEFLKPPFLWTQPAWIWKLLAAPVCNAMPNHHSTCKNLQTLTACTCQC